MGICLDGFKERLQDDLVAVDELVKHGGKGQLQIVVSDIKHGAFASIRQVRVAYPGCVFPIGAGMDSPAESVPTFAA